MNGAGASRRMPRYLFDSAAVLVLGAVFGTVHLVVLVLILILVLVLILILVLLVHWSLPPGSFAGIPLE